MQRYVKNFLIAFVIVFALGPAVFLTLYTDRYAKGSVAAVVGAIGTAQTANLAAGAAQSAVAAGAPPVNVVGDIPKERDTWQQVLISGLENAAYGFLKGLSRKVAIEMAQGAVRTIAVGGGGKEPLFHTKPWDQYLKEASLDAAGFFLEGAVQGWKDADVVENLKKDQDTAKKFKDEILPGLERDKETAVGKLAPLEQEYDILKLREADLLRDLRNCPPEDNTGRCGGFRGNLNSVKTQLQSKNTALLEARTAVSQADVAYTKGREILPTLEKRAEEAKKTYAQIPHEVLERRLKYQEGDSQGGFSEEARNVIANACNPNQLFLLNLTIGLGFSKPRDLKPTCNLEEAFKNWDEAFRNSVFYNVSMRELLEKQANGWKTAQSMINPFGEPDVAVAFKLNLIDHEEKREKSLVAQLKRKDETPFKPITTLGGIIKTPSEVVRNQALEQINKAHDFDSRLYGKIQVDLTDIALTFTESLFGRLGEIWMEGLQYAPDIALEGKRGSRIGFSNEKLLISPGAFPVYNSARVLEARLTRLADVTFSRGSVQNLLTEFQSQNEQSYRSQVIDRALAQAIVSRLTIQEAMEKYEQSKSLGINQNSLFGFDKNGNEGDKGYTNSTFPYRSMVILRKYRVLPVSWELTALYIRKNPQLHSYCGNQGCTLKVLTQFFNDNTSPFYRLIDPQWVLKLPASFCEMQGYGPPLPNATEQNDQCMQDTNKDGNLVCEPRNLLDEDFRDPNLNKAKGPRLLEELQKIKNETCTSVTTATLGSLLSDNLKKGIKDLYPGGGGSDLVGSHPLKDYINLPCQDALYGTPAQRGLLDEMVTIQRRTQMCLDERTCLSEDTNGNCQNEKYGYCLEERKRFQFEGSECKPENKSCDTFTDRTTQEVAYYIKDKLPDDNIQRDAQGNITGNLCKAENAGCRWVSSVRNIGSKLDQMVTVLRGGRGSSTPTPVPVQEEGKPIFAIHEWDASQKVYLNAKAGNCPEDSEGCTRLTCPDDDAECLAKARQENPPTQNMPDSTKDRYFKMAPDYLKCAITDPLIKGKPSYKRTECKPFALNCSENFSGCQRYASSNGDPAVAATKQSLQLCKQECSGLSSFIKTATDFESSEPTTSNDQIVFIPTKVQMCPSQEVGCDEFTNLDEKERGGEGLEYFTHLQACEKMSASPTVFYTYYGSDTSGYKPEKVFLKPDSSGHPACASGMNCVCDEPTFTSQKTTPNTSFTCREFINAAGGKSYRHWDRVVYQTDDCHPYRRTLDGPNGQIRYATEQFGLSKQCSRSNATCREYKNGRAGNVWVQFYDNFENKTTSDWITKRPDEYSALPSSEAETLDNTSLLIEPRENRQPEIIEIKRSVDIAQNASYQLMLGIKGGQNNKLTIKLVREENGVVAREITMGTIAALDGTWQHVKFFVPHISFEASKDQGGYIVLIVEKGAGNSGRVIVDDIALKKMEGVVYALQTSITSQQASPAICRASLGTELNCLEYKTPQGRSEYFSSVRNLCPTEVVGCTKFMQGQTPTYIVDDQSKLCPRNDEYCTAYGRPKLYNEIDGTEHIVYERVDSKRNILNATTNGLEEQAVIQKTYQWDTEYYKVTPQQAASGAALLESSQNSSQEVQKSIYDKGICKQEENGCRAYDTQFERKTYYFMGSKKILCEQTAEGVWKRKVCSVPNTGNTVSQNISCAQDEQCVALYGKGSQCNIQIECPKNQPVKNQYLYTCAPEQSGCRNITDPECVEARRCSGTSIRCDDTGIKNTSDRNGDGTFNDTDRDIFCRTDNDVSNPQAKCEPYQANDDVTRTDYGRYRVGGTESSCRRNYYYLADLSERSQKQKRDDTCASGVDVEKGCLAFQDENGQVGSTLFSSQQCYGEYYKNGARAAQPLTGCSTGIKDANTVLKVKQDRECKTWLACLSYEQKNIDGRIKNVCNVRIPCSRGVGSSADECADNGVLWTPGETKNVAQLSHFFRTPYTQLKGTDGAQQIAQDNIDYTYLNLSGMSRPDFIFGKAEEKNVREIFSTDQGSYDEATKQGGAGTSPDPLLIYYSGHDGYFGWTENKNETTAKVWTLDVEKNKRDGTNWADKNKIVLSCKVYPDELAPTKQRGRYVNSCTLERLEDGGNVLARGLYGYCLEPYPTFGINNSQRQYEVYANNLSSNQKLGYLNYCLNWYPVDYTQAAPPADNAGEQVQAFDTPNAYYCTQKGSQDVRKYIGEHKHIVAEAHQTRNMSVRYVNRSTPNWQIRFNVSGTESLQHDVIQWQVELDRGKKEHNEYKTPVMVYSEAGYKISDANKLIENSETIYDYTNDKIVHWKGDTLSARLKTINTGYGTLKDVDSSLFEPSARNYSIDEFTWGERKRSDGEQSISGDDTWGYYPANEDEKKLKKEDITSIDYAIVATHDGHAGKVENRYKEFKEGLGLNVTKTGDQITNTALFRSKYYYGGSTSDLSGVDNWLYNRTLQINENNAFKLYDYEGNPDLVYYKKRIQKTCNLPIIGDYDCSYNEEGATEGNKITNHPDYQSWINNFGAVPAFYKIKNLGDGKILVLLEQVNIGGSGSDARYVSPHMFTCKEVNFIAIKAFFGNDGKLRGWHWRYCDGGGSSGVEFALLNITVHTVHEYSHPINRVIKRSYCKEFVKASDVNSNNTTKAVTYLSQIREGSTGKSSKVKNGTNTITGMPTTLTSLDRPVIFSQSDEDVPSSISHHYDSTKISQDELNSNDHPKVVSPSGNTYTYNPIIIQENGDVEIAAGKKPIVSGRVFDITVPSYTKTVESNNDYEKGFIGNQYGTYFPKQYEKRLWSENVSDPLLGSYGVTEGEKWITDQNAGKTDARAPRIKNTSSANNQFSYELRNRGRGITIKFYTEAETDQLPLRRIRIDWGIGAGPDSKRPDQGEGIGFDNRTTGDPLTFSLPALGKGRFVMGRTVCIEVTDNWDAKRIVCGKFGGDVDSMTVNWCSGINESFDTVKARCQ